jgi:hypothetical protein
MTAPRYSGTDAVYSAIQAAVNEYGADKERLSVMSSPNDGLGANKGRPGPEPERVKIDEPWEDAVAKALRKPRPAEGWPKGDDSKDEPEPKDDGPSE